MSARSSAGCLDLALVGTQQECCRPASCVGARDYQLFEQLVLQRTHCSADSMRNLLHTFKSGILCDNFPLDLKPNLPVKFLATHPISLISN